MRHKDIIETAIVWGDSGSQEKGDVRMADEDKDKTEEGTADTETQEADSTATTETKDTDTAAADEAKAIRDERDALKKELQDSHGARNDLQSKYDTGQQELVKTKKTLDELTPLVDFDAVGGAGAPAGGEGEQTFLTRDEAKALEVRLDQKIRTNEFMADFRSKYPDLGDKGPKEQMVTYFFTEKTLHTESFDKRVESAVKAVRTLLKSEQTKGADEVKETADKDKKETEAKAKAAAQASGLSSAGITSPQSKTADENEDESLSDYAANRKAKTEKLKSPGG